MYNPTNQIKNAVEYINAVKKGGTMNLTKPEVVKGLEELANDIPAIEIEMTEEDKKIILSAIQYLQQEPIGREELREKVIVRGRTTNCNLNVVSGIKPDYEVEVEIDSKLPQQEVMSPEEIKKIIPKELTINDPIYYPNPEQSQAFRDGHNCCRKDLIKALSHIPAGKEEKYCECKFDSKGELPSSIFDDNHIQYCSRCKKPVKLIKPLPKKTPTYTEDDFISGNEMAELIKDTKTELDKIEAVLARGYCMAKNSKKTVDPNLIKSMAYQLYVAGYSNDYKSEKTWRKPEEPFIICKCKGSIGQLVEGWSHLQCKECKLPISKIEIRIEPEKTCLNCGKEEDCNFDKVVMNCSSWKPQEAKVIEPLNIGKVNDFIYSMDRDKYVGDKINELVDQVNHLTQDKK